jgi:CheY-like chemotaxis protein
LGNWRSGVPNILSSIAGKRGLVLDDEFLIALDIQHILEQNGAANVVCAGNADDALDRLRAGAVFDFAVLDIKLSGGARDSQSVAAELTRQNVPFVFLTGVDHHDKIRKQYPDAPVVEKPYDMALLLDAVTRVLGGR